MIYPLHYRSKLDLLQTQQAIHLIKNTFEQQLSHRLHLTRVSAPMLVLSGTGINDDLNGVEQPVRFSLPAIQQTAEIVHSLAKWKRLALLRYGFHSGIGLYTDMNAIRREEHVDNLHSVYVDQWDWEAVLDRPRSLSTLRSYVLQIVFAIQATQRLLLEQFPELTLQEIREPLFLTTQQLQSSYPHLTPRQREKAVCQKYGTVFLMQIGIPLADGQPHDLRAPDYDDWTLNGDLLVWSPVLKCPVELSSMGIRVDARTLLRQLESADALDRLNLPYHRLLAEGKLPQTVGGGIGQSRLCMLLLDKAHIGEVQASIWGEAARQECLAHNIHLL